MTTKYYVNATGKYLGAFDGAPAPAGGIQIASPPADARQTWIGSGWSALPQEVPKEVSRRRGLQALFMLHGLRDTDIEAAIATHITNQDEQYMAMTEFRTSQTFELDRPLLVMMCAALGLDRPALFTYAANLP